MATCSHHDHSSYYKPMCPVGIPESAQIPLSTYIYAIKLLLEVRFVPTGD
jgi:hypothetical protein